MAKKEQAQAEEQTEVKSRGNALIEQKNETPVAHVPVTLDDLESSGLLEKMGVTKDTVTNYDVNTYIRKAVGLPERVRATVSPEKKQVMTAISKAMKGMDMDALKAFAKERNIEIPEIEGSQ